MPIYFGQNNPADLRPDGYYSALDVYGPEIDGTACQQALDAVFFEALVDCNTFNYELYFPRTSGPSSPIASVRMVAKDAPAERLVQELSGKWPEHRFVLVKNGFYGAEPQVVEYQAGRVTSPERGPGTAGLLSLAVQQLTRSYELSQHVFVWQGQYASTEFFSMSILAAELDACSETIADLLDDEDRLSFSQLKNEYEQRASAFTNKRQAADRLHDSLEMLKEPWLVEALDHEGRGSFNRATEALQSALNTLHLALRDLDLNRRAD